MRLCVVHTAPLLRWSANSWNNFFFFSFSTRFRAGATQWFYANLCWSSPIVYISLIIVRRALPIKHSIGLCRMTAYRCDNCFAWSSCKMNVQSLKDTAIVPAMQREWVTRYVHLQYRSSFVTVFIHVQWTYIMAVSQDDSKLEFAAKVDCSGLGLIELPKTLPAMTTTLNVSNNNVTCIFNIITVVATVPPQSAQTPYIYIITTCLARSQFEPHR